jgi:[glutamine synthetase] adenylyltransferase / [glutamine synthetase]-adenylyl-L-tyrosine phosphorylase
MNSASFASRLQQPFPMPHDAGAIKLFWEQEGAAALAHQKTFIDGVISGSPFVAQLLRDHAPFAVECFAAKPEELLEAILEDASGAQEDLPKHLRFCRAKIALLCALCDLGNVWSLDEVTGALTRFADAAVNAALNHLLKEAHEAGRIIRAEGAGSGYVILAMGKHGAFELNYSSDIDLIVLFDDEQNALPPDAEPSRFFVKLTQQLVALLQDVTEHGYVFRVDLRLRPDPRATQVAISIQSAEQYYLNLGQNWERAAFIKARAIAGDIALGQSFLRNLQPYIWRKYLDFASIADVQSLIRQIHTVKGHGEIAVEGHNLKLGRGGIREIELFVQTQQLIAGGRNPALRGQRTVDMLDALAEAKWITPSTASDLKSAYVKLRQWEHRAQMQRDEQTHNLPAGDAFSDFAAFCGQDETSFRQDVLETLTCVRDHAVKLFEQSEGLGGAGGALVFTGGDDDPETLETLRKLGYARASEVSAIVRGWHFGRYAATRDRRSREFLTELMPKLLEALAQGGDADRSFFAFDDFLKGLPAGVQLFAMCKSHPGLLNLLALVLATAPRLAQELSRQPRILEAVLDPDFFGAMPEQTTLAQSARQLVPTGLALEEAMDRMRVFVREQKFRVGVRVLSETVSAEEAGKGFAAVAETAIAALLNAVREDVARQHGVVEGGRVAVLAMGKLGGREMTAGSDLDFFVIYDHAESCQSSTGPREVAPAQYYTKLTQRLVTAISTPTAEGELYDVDLRLRPSGSKGPLAVSFASFKTYQSDSAWTWEKLALTRARSVAGDASLRQELETEIAKVLASKRDTETTRKDVVDMRSLMLRELKTPSHWDIKRVRGGLVELEFIAQFLQLIHAHDRSAILDTNSAAAIAKLRDANLLNAAETSDLLSANRLYHRLTQILRLCLEEDYQPAQALPALNRLVAQAAESPDMASAEALLRQTQTQVSALFDRLVGPPAK